MADVYTEGYRVGFINTGKDLSKKSIVNIRYSLGFEKVICLAIENFRKMGLKPVIYRAASSVITKREHHKIDITVRLRISSMSMITDRTRHSLWISVM